MFHVIVIGAGTMGSVHSQAYAHMDNVKLAGIVDIRKEKGEALAAICGTQAFGSFEEALLAVGQVDLIDVCLPTYLHKEYVLKSANLGKHVVCEKPLARNLEDAAEMIRVCKEKGVKLFIGHVLRFFPEYTRAKQLLEANAIGEPAVVRTTRGGGFPVAWNNWYADFKKSGGLLLDAIIHDFDFLRWCFGDVERVYGKGLRGRELAQMDYTLVTLRFKSGVIAHVEGTWAHQSFSMRLEIAGKTGIIDYDSAKDSPLFSFSRTSGASSVGVAVPESPLQENPYYRELKHFISCIENGSEPIVSAEDAYEAMRIALAAIESVDTGKPVTLEASREVQA
jgi:UDP-N-acetylglucosamine 3-dehydrogenase